MKVYNKFQDMVDDAKECGLPMSMMLAEGLNQLFGRLSLLEKDHDALIEENRKLKKKLEK